MRSQVNVHTCLTHLLLLGPEDKGQREEEKQEQKLEKRQVENH